MNHSRRNHYDQGKDRAACVWERAVKSFSKDGFTVQIDRQPLDRPRFSVSFGIFREGDGPDRFTSRIACRYHLADGDVVFETLPPPGVFDQLLDLAAEWIEGEILASEERRQEGEARRRESEPRRGTR